MRDQCGKGRWGLARLEARGERHLRVSRTGQGGEPATAVTTTFITRITQTLQ